jgi:phytol kinase
MRRGDGLALGGYALVALLTLALAEALRQRGVSPRLTRKLVHVMAGISPLYVTYMAESKRVGLLPYLLTILLNFLLWKKGWLASLADGTSSPGIVYFPISQSALLAWLWEPDDANRSRLPVAHAALLTLALGDAAAALVGQRYGRHTYRVFGSQRSLEGSAAMLVVTGGAVGATLALSGIERGQAMKNSALAAAGATLIEALSPLGTDNLTVPAAVALILLQTGEANAR